MARWCVAYDLAEVADRDQLVEGLGQFGVVDGFAADPDALEDGLVEQPARAGCGQLVGGLEPIGQLERDIEAGEDVAVINGEFGLQLLGGGSFAPQAVLFFGEESFGDLVGVVGGEQLAFLAVEGADRFGDAGAFGGDAGVEVGDVALDVVADLAAAFGVELDGRVVVFDGEFDGEGAVMRLGAGALLASATHEVLVDAAVAVSAGVDQPALAVGAVQAAAQVVVVAPVALAALALGIEDVLDGLERRQVDQRVVAAVVGLAGVAQGADVVGVSQQSGEAVGAQGSPRRAAGALAAQAAGFEDGAELGQRVVAGGVEPEGVGDQRAAVGVDGDGADLASVGDLADVDVADRCSERRAAAFGLLGRAFLDFEAEVLGVELGDRAHDAVQQQAGRCLVDVLAD